MGRLESLKIGGFTMSDVVTGLSDDAGGAFPNADEAGSIGGDLLRRFTATFDYSRQEMILEPNARFSEPFEYDMSGMFLSAVEPEFSRFRIQRLVENSPAAEAGLSEGDIITAFDGRPSSDFTLNEVRRLFLQEGKSWTLEVQRGEETRTVELKLRRLI